MYVTEADHRRALALVGDIAQTTSLTEFLGVALPGLHRVLGADEVTYSEITVRTSRIGPTFGYPTPPQAAASAARVWSTRSAEHPWVRFAVSRHRRGAARLSDLCARSTLQRSAFYQDFYRPRGVDYADYLPVAVADGAVIGLALSRSHRDFSDAEHDVVEHLRRPLGGVWSGVRRSSVVRPTPVDAPPSSLANPALTPSERRVAELVSRGWSNREVAAALGVSAKSVEQHLTRVYRLLGVRSRSQLVRVAMGASPS